MKYYLRVLFSAALVVAIPVVFLSTDLKRWVVFSWYGYSGDGILIISETGSYPKYTIRLPAAECIKSSDQLYRVPGLSTNGSWQTVARYRLSGVPPCPMSVGIDIVDENSGEQISGFGEVANMLSQTHDKLVLEITDSNNHSVVRFVGPLSIWNHARSGIRIHLWQRKHDPIVFDPSEEYSIRVIGSLPNALLHSIRLQPVLEGGGVEALY